MLVQPVSGPIRATRALAGTAPVGPTVAAVRGGSGALLSAAGVKRCASTSSANGAIVFGELSKLMRLHPLRKGSRDHRKGPWRYPAGPRRSPSPNTVRTGSASSSSGRMAGISRDALPEQSQVRVALARN